MALPPGPADAPFVHHDYNDLQTLLRNLVIALAFPQTGPLLLTRYCLPRVPVFCATFLATRKEKESPRAILIETPNVSRTCFICSESRSSGDVLLYAPSPGRPGKSELFGSNQSQESAAGADL